VPIEMAYKVGQQDFRLEVERVRNSKPDAVVHWGDAVEGAMILNAMREMGMTQPFFGCDRTVSEDFLKIAGRNAEGVVATYPWDPARNSARLERFRKAYRERYGVEAETYAAHAYDGMNLMLWAIQAAGLNRAKIRDVIAHLPHPWPGVTGDIVLSAALDDVGETTLARFEGGRWSFQTRAALQVPQGYVPPRDRLNRDAETAQGAAAKPPGYPPALKE
jgi:ABC-type branched-subunit amino acid transport system substrate-binding protein